MQRTAKPVLDPHQTHRNELIRAISISSDVHLLHTRKPEQQMAACFEERLGEGTQGKQRRNTKMDANVATWGKRHEESCCRAEWNIRRHSLRTDQNTKVSDRKTRRHSFRNWRTREIQKQTHSGLKFPLSTSSKFSSSLAQPDFHVFLTIIVGLGSSNRT